MKNDLAFCQIQGHEMQKIKYICTYKQCQQAQRLICDECLTKQLHTHGSSIKLDDFLTYLNHHVQPKLDHQKDEVQITSKFIKELQDIMKQLQYIIESFELFQQQTKKIIKTYKQANKNIHKLSNQDLNTLINYDEGNIDYIQIQNNVQKIVLSLQELNKEFFRISFVPQLEIKKKNISSPNLSQNEQYLTFLFLKNLSLMKINNNKIIRNNKLKKQINIVKFSRNSQFIFVGDMKGNFKYISIKNSFKTLFSKRINIFAISDILEIDNNQVILAQHQMCIIDLIKRRVILRINHQLSLNCLEFDRINNLIICLIQEKLIRFYDRNGNTSTSLQQSFHKRFKKHDMNWKDYSQINLIILSDERDLLFNNEKYDFIYQEPDIFVIKDNIYGSLFEIMMIVLQCEELTEIYLENTNYQPTIQLISQSFQKREQLRLYNNFIKELQFMEFIHNEGSYKITQESKQEYQNRLSYIEQCLNQYPLQPTNTANILIDDRFSDLDTFSFEYTMGIYLPIILPFAYPIILGIYDELKVRNQI